jgi:hypothetical protein
VDVGEQCELDHGHERRLDVRAWLDGLHGGGQHERGCPYGDADGGGADGDDYAGGRQLQLQRVTDERVGAVDR